jgi:hypothetical protein
MIFNEKLIFFFCLLTAHQDGLSFHQVIACLTPYRSPRVSKENNRMMHRKTFPNTPSVHVRRSHTVTVFVFLCAVLMLVSLWYVDHWKEEQRAAFAAAVGPAVVKQLDLKTEELYTRVMEGDRPFLVDVESEHPIAWVCNTPRVRGATWKYPVLKKLGSTRGCRAEGGTIMKVDRRRMHSIEVVWPDETEKFNATMHQWLNAN